MANRFLCSPDLLLDSVALLEFLPAAAGAGVVAAYFFAGATLRGCACFSGPGEVRCGEFALLLALELLLQRVDGG